MNGVVTVKVPLRTAPSLTARTLSVHFIFQNKLVFNQVFRLNLGIKTDIRQIKWRWMFEFEFSLKTNYCFLYETELKTELKPLSIGLILNIGLKWILGSS